MVFMTPHTLATAAAAATTATATLRECIASGGNRPDREHDCGERSREGLLGFRGVVVSCFSGANSLFDDRTLG
jgi:hypothetical protein